MNLMKEQFFLPLQPTLASFGQFWLIMVNQSKFSAPKLGLLWVSDPFNNIENSLCHNQGPNNPKNLMN